MVYESYSTDNYDPDSLNNIPISENFDQFDNSHAGQRTRGLLEEKITSLRTLCNKVSHEKKCN